MSEQQIAGDGRRREPEQGRRALFAVVSFVSIVLVGCGQRAVREPFYDRLTVTDSPSGAMCSCMGRVWACDVWPSLLPPGVLISETAGDLILCRVTR